MKMSHMGAVGSDLQIRSLGYVGAVKALCCLLEDQYLAAGESLLLWHGKMAAWSSTWDLIFTYASAIAHSR